MKVSASAINASSQHQSLLRETRVQIQHQRTLPQARPAEPPRVTAPPPKAADRAGKDSTEDSPEQTLDARLAQLKALVELLSGKKIDTAAIKTGAEAESGNGGSGKSGIEQGNSGAASTGDSSTGENRPAPPRQVETVTFSHQEHYEYEYTSVTIGGTLMLDSSMPDSSGDGNNKGNGQGKLLDISLSLTMERSYYQSSTELSVTRGKPTDPLVVNLGNSPVALSARTTPFDLNGDGSKESIATLASNSAYLALDRNGDGNIGSGSELFGPSSGNSFAELSRYDSDGNGFIDAADPVFNQLQLFRPGDGFQQSLAEAGIGALYTGSVDSPMRLADSANNMLGQVRATGFYVKEDGGAGSLQQVDLVV